jgi:hypothetical protein
MLLDVQKASFLGCVALTDDHSRLRKAARLEDQ